MLLLDSTISNIMDWFPSSVRSNNHHHKKGSTHSPKKPSSPRKVSHTTPAHHPHASPIGKTNQIGKHTISPPSPKRASSPTKRTYKPIQNSSTKFTLGQQSQKLFKHDVAAAKTALRNCFEKLEVATQDSTTWNAYQSLSRNSPVAAEFLKKWFSEILGCSFPTSFSSSDKSCKQVLALLRSSSGRAIVKHLEGAFKEVNASVGQLKHIKRLNETLSRDGSFAETWRKLPQKVKDNLRAAINKINHSPENSDAALRLIHNNPKILHSLSKQNCLQKEAERIEAEIVSTFSKGQAAATKKCSDTLLHVDLSKYRDKIDGFKDEIKKLQQLKVTVNNQPKFRNESLEKFANLEQDTTNALEYLVWVADGKPNNGDFAHGFHRLENNMGLLDSIKEENSKASLIDWAILFYQTQIENYQSLAELKALKNLLDNRKKESYSTQVLFWLFKNANQKTIRDPLIKLLGEQGDSLEDLKKQPRLLVIEKTLGSLSPIANLIAKREKRCLSSIHDFVQSAEKPLNEGDRSKVNKNIGVERFSQAVQDSGKEPKKIALVTPEYAKLFDAGGLAPAMQGLAHSLAKTNKTVNIILPYYKDLLPDAFKKAKKTTTYRITDGTKDNKPCKVWKAHLADAGIFSHYGLQETDRTWAKNVNFYMIDPSSKYKDMFKKAYGGADEKRRFVYFQSAAAELLHQMYTKKRIDVFHANDWATSLISMGMHHRYPRKEVPPNIFAVHNNANDYVPEIDGGTLAWANLIPDADKNKRRNTVIEGMLHADQVVTVSKNFAKEVQTKEVGFGIDPWFRLIASQNRLSGIINGNNTAAHNPATDRTLQNWVDPDNGRSYRSQVQRRK